MGFRPFTEYGSKLRDSLSLRVNGNLFVSDGVISRFSKDKPKAICVFIDEEKTRIGMEFLQDKDDSRKECRIVSQEKSGISFNIIPILNFFKIKKLKKKASFNFTSENNMIIIDLSELKNSEEN